METAAVAQVCGERGVSWVAFRGISDLAGDPSMGEVVMTLVRPDGSPDLRSATRFFLRHPGRLPRMVRLGRESSVAATTAARASVSALVRPAARAAAADQAGSVPAISVCRSMPPVTRPPEYPPSVSRVVAVT